MFKIIIFLFIIEINCLNLAYLGNTNDCSDSNGIYKSIIETLTDNTLIIPQCIEKDPIDIEKSLETIGKSDTQLIITECNSDLFDLDSDVIENYNLFIWCTNTYAIPRCSNHFMSGVVLTPVIEQLLLLISLDYNSKIALLLGNDKNFDEFYRETFEYDANKLGVEVVYVDNTTLSGDVADVNVDDFIKKIGDEDSVVILSTIKKTDILTKIVSELKANSMTSANYPIIFLPGGIKFNDVRNIPDIEGNMYIIPHYETETVDGITFNVEDADTAVLYGVIKGLLNANSKIPSDLIKNILSQYYNEEVEYPGGKIILLPNNYITITEHIISIDSASTITHKYTISPDASIHYANLYGKVIKEDCNFLDNPETGIIEQDNLPFGIIIDFNSYAYKVVRAYFEEMVKNINIEGRILGKYMIPVPIDTNNKDIDEIIEEVYEIYYR